jgi:mannosyltransferase OCH1-like enzyme
MIPEILHHVWLGPNPVKGPEFRMSFMRHNPLWTFMCWTDRNVHEADVSGDVKRIVRDRTIPYIVKTDLLRYALLFSYGGVYSDWDMLCNRSLAPLLDTHGFSSVSYYGQMGNALIGCIPGYEEFGKLEQIIQRKIIEDPNACTRDPARTTGVEFQAKYLENCETIYPREHFQPFPWKSLEGRDQQWPDSYTVHHWWGMDPDGWINKRF